MNSLKSIVAIAATSLLAVPAFALSYDAGVNGTTSPAGVSITGYTGWAPTALGTKTSLDGYTSLGVVGGNSGNEIDINQSLKVAFNAPQIVTSLTLGLLFNGGEYNDFNEIAVAKVIDTLSTYKLTATGDFTSSWTGLGSASNKAPAIINKGGVWEILNPFGGLAITGFWLYPENNPWAPKGKNPSDFGLVSFSTVRVPDAASTMVLAGVSLLGLALVARRRD